MGREKSFAGVYMMLHKKNGKMYIGESGNVLRRFVEHRTNKNSIIYKLGSENFVPIVLESSITDERLLDADYRSKREAFYIEKYKTDQEKHGYNILSIQYHTKKDILEKHTIRFNQIIANIQKGKNILVYDTDTGEVFMCLSRQSFASLMDTDRSIIARAVITGKRYKQYNLYALDPELRMNYATKIIDKKVHNRGKNGKAEVSLKRYRKGLKATNEFCKKWDLPTIELDSLL